MWEGLWSHAIYDLHLTEKQFWSLTPYQLSLLTKRHKSRVNGFLDWLDYRFGIVDHLIVNWSSPPPKEPTKPTDFMPSFQERKQQPSQWLDDDAIARKIDALLRPRSLPKVH
jgi:hypothetical protein